jgi:hypothetical protein
VKVMMKFRKRLNDDGSLPAIMGAAILISATAVLLGAYAVAQTRNAEVSIMKTSLNAAVTSCENTLSTTVQKTFSRDVQSTASNLLKKDGPGTAENPSLKDLAEANCNYTNIKTNVRVVDAVNYASADSLYPQSIKVTFQSSYSGLYPSTLNQIRYINYPDAGPQNVAKDSYISTFDAEGNAVWVGLTP